MAGFVSLYLFGYSYVLVWAHYGERALVMRYFFPFVCLPGSVLGWAIGHGWVLMYVVGLWLHFLALGAGVAVVLGATARRTKPRAS